MNHLFDPMKEIPMPDDMKRGILTGCRCSNGSVTTRAKKYHLIASCLAVIIVLFTCSVPCLAAYNVYKVKTLRVFFATDISQEQIDQIGTELERMDGITTVKFIGADEAWEDFSEQYLTKELTEEIGENPLTESYNYKVSVELTANTKQIRESIKNIDGVRKVTNLMEE